jgi:beta-lactamase superfamily II metal-dependent hydrolase
VLLLAAGSAPAQVTVHYVNVGQAAKALLEFDSGLVMVDAGGESTSDKPSGDVYRKHLVDYIGKIFAKHPEWNNVIEGLIISHPHIDHTMLIMDVMQNFSVHTLVDNGAQCGSGIPDLVKARAFAAQKHISYLAIGDATIHKGGYPLHLLENSGPDAPQILLLSGGRGCLDFNNDSIAVRVVTKEAAILFAGDSENEDSGKKTCSGPKGVSVTLAKCDAGMSLLETRYGATGLLKADLYQSAHHGSPNGFSPEFLSSVSPGISVISAGDALRAGPGPYHGYEYGHPRIDAVTELIKETTGTRSPAAQALVFNAANTANSKVVSPAAPMSIDKAVYCTCWDGDVQVAYAAGSTVPVVTTDGFLPAIAAGDRPKPKK